MSGDTVEVALLPNVRPLHLAPVMPSVSVTFFQYTSWEKGHILEGLETAGQGETACLWTMKAMACWDQDYIAEEHGGDILRKEDLTDGADASRGGAEMTTAGTWLPLLGGVQDMPSLFPPSQHQLQDPSPAVTGRVV